MCPDVIDFCEFRCFNKNMNFLIYYSVCVCVHVCEFLLIGSYSLHRHMCMSVHAGARDSCWLCLSLTLKLEPPI